MPQGFTGPHYHLAPNALYARQTSTMLKSMLFKLTLNDGTVKFRTAQSLMSEDQLLAFTEHPEKASLKVFFNEWNFMQEIKGMLPNTRTRFNNSRSIPQEKPEYWTSDLDPQTGLYTILAYDRTQSQADQRNILRRC